VIRVGLVRIASREVTGMPGFSGAVTITANELQIGHARFSRSINAVAVCRVTAAGG
jgi:hypothetical protein